MRRVFFVHGDKGGIGKSQAATRTASAFAATGKPLILVDGDARNPAVHNQFSKAGVPVHRCNILVPQGIEEFFELIASAEHDLLIDMPAGGSAATAMMKSGGAAEGSIDLAGLAAEVDAEIVVLFVIDQNREVLVALRDELNAFPQNAKWIIVRNGFQDREFSEFNESKVKAMVDARGGVVIDMIRLDPAITARMTREGLDLNAVIASPETSVIQRIRAKSALNSWIEQLKLAGVL